jgi:hypothetical protein
MAFELPNTKIFDTYIKKNNSLQDECKNEASAEAKFSVNVVQFCKQNSNLSF